MAHLLGVQQVVERLERPRQRRHHLRSVEVVAQRAAHLQERDSKSVAPLRHECTAQTMGIFQPTFSA